ncbi:MAG: hypothetical protein AAGJ79_12470 [Verrucomicrobiota bacterium]
MNTQVFTICLVVTGLVSAGIVLYYAKKNPNPYFRPKKGELVMMSLFLAILCGISSFILSQFFQADINLKEFAAEDEMRRQQSVKASKGGPSSEYTPSSTIGSSATESGMSSGSAPRDAPSIPPFTEGR